MSWQEKLKKRKQKRRRVILISLCSVLAALYVAVAVYFGFHFYGDTVVFGIDCSHKTVEQVETEIAQKLGNYTLEIRERGEKTETLSAGQISLQYVDDSSIDRMMKAQKSWLWPVMFLLDRDGADSVAFSYDRKLAESCIAQLECMDSLMAVPPQDAYIGNTDTGFEVVPEVMGTTVDQEKTKETLLASLDEGRVSVSLEEEGCYVNPQIYRDNEELNRDAAAMSELACGYITYDFGTQQEIVNSTLIRDWIVKLSDGSFVIDDVCVTNYVESLAAKYDTFGLPLDFYTSLGTTVTLSGGDYGWCIDQSATVVQLLNALAEGYRGTLEPVYLYKAMSHENQ
ncbi:MAG: peptidoglycan binding domain-containing protein, partial [Pyramidobacter sp.]|nr:peptidoglycan binding domain-containing protein [Pyramidobacter sp.]